MKIETRYSQKLTKKDIPVFTTDSFTNKAAEAFTIQSLRENHSKMLSLRKEPFRNIHDTSRIDTIYHYSGKRDTIKFYRSREKDLMIYLQLISPELALDSCVYPGMNKETFLSIFGINRPVGNTIQLANSDGTLRFIFYFRDDELERIKSDFYFE
ncbi:MAG: hypothetical protein ACQER7_00145 [Bacteroidota bacterium]